MMPGDPVVGSTVLRRPAIQSPNFVTTVSGWTINADGSAEFNNLTIRGTFNGTDFVINSSGEFFYSPSEGAGNLVASSAPAAGTDGFGNHYVAGQASYSSSLASALTAGSLTTYAGSLAAGWTPAAVIVTNSFGDLILQAASGRQVITANNILDNGTGGGTFQSDVSVDGANLNVGSGSAANINLNPKMATPPNQSLIAAGTASAAQICAWANGLYTSMKNRGMFN